jgi:gamma-glutamyltranspeptidase/glutathione hydrolase
MRVVMRLNTGGTALQKARNGQRSRQLYSAALIAAAAFLLSGCGTNETSREIDRANNAANPAGLPPGRQGLSRVVATSSFAAATADESRAAEIGRDILANGGNATDAAVAMYFALAVTLPSAASLGASGACIVHDDKSKQAESFVFAPIAAPGPIKGASFSVPNGVRAVTLMHVRHGSSRWEAVVAPAERLARFGVPVSRALSRDLQAGAGMLGDNEAQRILGNAREGSNLIQTELAGTLGAIRQRGGAEFFQGQLARTISEQISQAGGSMPVDVLRSAVPQASAPMSESHYRRRVYVSPAPMAGASALAGWKGSAPGGAVPVDSNGFAGLAAADGQGGAAACALSMGQLLALASWCRTPASCSVRRRPMPPRSARSSSPIPATASSPSQVPAAVRRRRPRRWAGWRAARSRMTGHWEPCCRKRAGRAAS